MPINTLATRVLAVLILLVYGVLCFWTIAVWGLNWLNQNQIEPTAVNVNPGVPGPDDFILMGFYSEDYQEDRSSLESLSLHGESLDGVSPFWYSIDASGKINTRGGARRPAINQARASGVKVLGLFNNQSGTDVFLQHSPLRSAAVEEVVRTVESEGLDGVNIDFESLEPASREGLTRFMDELYPRLHEKGKIVTVSVFPKWSDNEAASEWSYAYDYTSLAEFADYLVVMAYDQHGAWSGPGPVAALGWVRGALNYALKRVPAGKIILGVAGYGYDWGGDNARVVFSREALSLAESWNAEVSRDPGSGERFFVYCSRGVRHQVWWEDAASVKEKVSLARKQGLAGAALWRLGQEEEALWPQLSDNTNKVLGK